MPFRYARNIPSPVISSIAPAQAPSARKVVYRATGPRGQRSSGVIHRGVSLVCRVSHMAFDSFRARLSGVTFQFCRPGGSLCRFCVQDLKNTIFLGVPIRARFDYNRVQVPRVRTIPRNAGAPAAHSALRIAQCCLNTAMKGCFAYGTYRNQPDPAENHADRAGYAPVRPVRRYGGLCRRRNAAISAAFV